MYTLRTSGNDIFAVKHKRHMFHHVVAFKQIAHAYKIGRCLETHLQRTNHLPDVCDISSVLHCTNIETDLKRIVIQKWENETDLLFFCHGNNLGLGVCHTPKRYKSGFSIIQSSFEPEVDHWTSVYLDSVFDRS